MDPATPTRPTVAADVDAADVIWVSGLDDEVPLPEPEPDFVFEFDEFSDELALL